MFNLSQSLKEIDSSNSFFPWFLQFFLQSFGVFVSLNIIRNQVPEIKLLQLIPGYYFFLLFIFIIIFFFISTFFSFYPSFLDSQKILGSKTISKNIYFITNKFFYFFSIFTLFFSSNFIIPSNFDAFYIYSEKTLENFWSFSDLINLYFILIFTLILISQLPLIAFYSLNNERKILNLPRYFKVFLFFILVVAGFLTPTVDISSQLIFSSFTILIYLISIHFLIKRISIKYLSFTFLN